MNLLEKINKHWNWTGLEGIEIVGNNEFGNFLVVDTEGIYWRICPEELSCKIVAYNLHEFSQLIENEGFQQDWEMSKVVEIARRCLGGLRPGWVYYLVIPGAFGGKYDADNIRSVPTKELIEHSGDWALAIKDLPEGGQIQIRIID